MTDREKVIKEFELFIKEYHPACTSEGVELDMFREVLALLKEQKAKEQCLKTKCIICPHCDNCDVDENGSLKEQDGFLGVQQTADGIKFISSGTVAQGEKRGIMLGKALIYDRLEKELLYRGLLTDDIRSTLVKVWEDLQ